MNLKDKRGITTIGIFTFIFTILVWIILLGVYVLIFNLTTTNLAIDVDMGQVNLKEVVDSTMGQLNTAFLNRADTIGYIIIFGLVLNMFVNAYLFRGKFPRLFAIVDIILLVFAYIVAVYVSNSYETLINATSDLSVYIDNLFKSSTFILKLPTFVSIIGVIIMILSYAGFPRETEEEVIIGQI